MRLFITSILLTLSCTVIASEKREVPCLRRKTRETTKTYTRKDNLLKWDHQLGLALLKHAKNIEETKSNYWSIWRELERGLGTKIRREVTVTTKKTYMLTRRSEILLMAIEADIDGLQTLRFEVQKTMSGESKAYKILEPGDIERKLDRCLG